MKPAQKQLVMDSIHRKPIQRVPMFYRADEIVSEKVMAHFGIDESEPNWDEKIIRELGADFFSGGPSPDDMSCYIPRYVGPEFPADQDDLFFFTFGINTRNVYDDQGRFFEYDFFRNPPLQNATSVSDIASHEFPQPDWFDFGQYKTLCSRESPSWYPQEGRKKSPYVDVSEVKVTDDRISNTYFMNTIWVIASFMRGMQNLLMDMAAEPKMAHALIDRVGEACVELSRANLEAIGDRIELYGMWDDFAMQNNMFMTPDQWREYFKPFYKRLIEDAKSRGLLVYFHCCGNLYEVIPDLIDIGVDILDPIQTSARRMVWEDLKRDFGKHLCFHGGMDIQKLLPHGTPEEITAEARRLKDLFDGEGGLLLGPSHLLTRDIPVENVAAMYR